MERQMKSSHTNLKKNVEGGEKKKQKDQKNDLSFLVPPVISPFLMLKSI